MTYTDLVRQTDFLDISVKLASVAIGLSYLKQGMPLEGYIQDAFVFAGDLTEQINNFIFNYKPNPNPEINELATSLKPEFYDIIFRKRINFQGNFYNRLSETLKSKGEVSDLNIEELDQLQSLYNQLSTYLLNKSRSILI